MNTCQFCFEVANWMVIPYGEDIAHTEYIEKPGWPRKRRVFERPPNPTCHFCVYLYDSLGVKDDRKENTLSIEVTVWLSKLRSAKGLYDCCMFVDLVTKGYTFFALWADAGTPAAQIFVTQSPIRSSYLDEACGLARSWLDECVSHHQCQTSIGGTAFPRRVLQIFGTIDAMTIQLVEASGMAGEYCALSHCWGPRDKQPIRTTRANYDHHVKGIALDDCPKSFQDFAMLARGIGIEFIWIDSLCIIQDDEQDWESQAETMDAIYRNATLVVAAAGAEDSTQGLFITDRPHTRMWKSIYGSYGILEGFNMSRLPAAVEQAIPWDCPLRRRGWVLQEWYLARRILFCMPLGLSWRCDGMDVTEGGFQIIMNNYEKDSWSQLLRSYTKRSLTYPSDRVHALRGVVAHLQRTRQDTFLHEFGVWQDNLHCQILWRQSQPYRNSDSLPLPTWSWAATGGAKLWTAGPWVEMADFLTPMTRRLEISGSGSLCSVGYLATSTLAVSLTQLEMEKMVSGILNWDHPGTYKFYEFAIMLPRKAEAMVPVYMAKHQSKTGKALGMFAFDSKPLKSVCYFFVGCARREPKDGEHDENDSSSSHEEVNSDSRDSPTSSLETDSTHQRLYLPPPSCSEPKLDQNNEQIGCNISLPAQENDGPDEVAIQATVDEIRNVIQTTSFVYLCLLLEPVGEGRYKRVGLALLYPHAFEAMKPNMTEFEII